MSSSINKIVNSRWNINMLNNIIHPPVVPAERTLHEITVKALILGVLLSMLLAAANAYIGLLVGLTVSASIPAAAVSMGILRFFKHSNILENNMVQTSASAGEALVAGVIFTIPALVMMGAWDRYDYVQITSISLIGGILGVAFTIPLRRALIIEAKLKFPEGVATGEVLKTGGIETNKDIAQVDPLADAESSKGFKRLITAAAIGAFFKIFESGLGVFAGGITSVKSWFSSYYLFSGSITFSPALLGVGYIVGLNVASLVFLGGTIGTLIGVPANWYFNNENILIATGMDPSIPWSDITANQWSALAGQAWQDCRRVGVGAMIVGGVWSLISLAKPLYDGVSASIKAYKEAKSGGVQPIRTEMDTPINIVAGIVLVMIVPLFYIFYNVLAEYEERLLIATVMTIFMLVFGFLFSSIAGYMSGLVGSSNNPISGVTIATVIISALILLQLMGNEGLAGTLGPVAVIYLAALVCTAAAIAGDNLQDLKCGHIVGSTPWKQQIFQVIGVISAAVTIPWVLNVLDAGYGIGRPSPIGNATTFLAAPQAGLMQALSTGIFGAGIKWNFIFIGFGLAIALIILDKYQEARGSEFRFPILAVAVGIYLPLGLSIPIFMGGVISHLVHKKAIGSTEKVKHKRANAGLLIASGLITGEALMGVLIAMIAAFIMPLPATFSIGPILGALAMLLTIIYLYKNINSAA